MPSPFIRELEASRTSQVGFVELEKGGPAGAAVAEIVSALVRTDQQPWRFDFRTGTLNTTEDWTLVQTGSGHSVVASSGNLVISTGATINTETILRSKRRFTLPVRATISLMLSQRVANQEFYIELVNLAGDVFARYKFDGTVVTSADIEVASGPIAANQTLNVTVTTPTTASASAYEIDLAMDEVAFRTRAVDSGAVATDRALRTTNLPHPDDELYLQIRAKNLAVAPTNTNLSVFYGWVQDVNELAVEVVGGRGNTGANSGVPVTLPAAPASSSRIGAVTSQGIWQQISVAAQAISAVSTGTARDLQVAVAGSASGSTAYFKEYRSLVWADQPGTLYVEVSPDNVTWRRVRAIPTTVVLAGNNVAEVSYLPTVRYARSVFVNGATANTAFLHADAYFSS